MIGKLLPIICLFLFQVVQNSASNGAKNQAVGECPEVDGEYVTLLPHGSDCTKFYICSEGTPVLWDCPEGLLFNPNLLVCDYPESAGCGEGSSGNGNTSGNGSEEETPAESEEEETPGNGGENQAVGECPEVDGEFVTLLPHASDCTKFYICNEGTPIVAECPAGLLFNPNLLVCDYPESAGCGEGSSGSGNTGLEEEEEEEEETPGNGGGNQAVGECPEVDGEFVTLLPHASDCTKFFICNEGTPVVTECPAGLLFNPTLLVCDFPESAGCGEGSSGNGNTGGNGSEEETPAESEEEETPGNGGENQAVGECPEVDGEFVTLLPHASDCTKFYICNEGTPVVAECPAGLLFNPTLLVCDYPESAGCGEGSSGSGNNGGNTGLEEEEEEEETPGNGGGNQAVGECPEVDGEFVTLLPHASDCTKFFICNEGTPVVTECPVGLLFNPTLLVCDFPESAGCVAGSSNNENVVEEETPVENGEEESSGNGGGNQAIGECPEIENGFLLPHASDCSKFYVCIGGEPIVQTCPSGLQFNPQLMVCDWPQHVNCNVK